MIVVVLSIKICIILLIYQMFHPISNQFNFKLNLQSMCGFNPKFYEH